MLLTPHAVLVRPGPGAGIDARRPRPAAEPGSLSPTNRRARDSRAPRPGVTARRPDRGPPRRAEPPVVVPPPRARRRSRSSAPAGQSRQGDQQQTQHGAEAPPPAGPARAPRAPPGPPQGRHRRQRRPLGDGHGRLLGPAVPPGPGAGGDRPDGGPDQLVIAAHPLTGAPQHLGYGATADGFVAGIGDD